MNMTDEGCSSTHVSSQAWPTRSVAKANSLRLSGVATSGALVQVVQRLWDAALMGDTPTVRQLLWQHGILPNTQHHICHSQLVLDIAESEAATEGVDRRLRSVLEALADTGWAMSVRKLQTGENALHLLAAQPAHLHVDHRLAVLLDASVVAPERAAMLAAEDWAGKLPEQRAAQHDRATAASLRAVRLQSQRACRVGGRT